MFLQILMRMTQYTINDYLLSFKSFVPSVFVSLTFCGYKICFMQFAPVMAEGLRFQC